MNMSLPPIIELATALKFISSFSEILELVFLLENTCMQKP
jgi:hypothetical protein